MAKKPPITETIIQILRDAPGPLSVDELAAQLEARLPGASKNYKNSVRNTLQNSRSGQLIKLPDGRIGLASRLVRGAAVRHILRDEDLADRELPVGADLADLLNPGGHSGPGAVRLELEDGPQIVGRTEGGRIDRLLDAGPAFWDWLEARGAAPGDSLIVTAVDPEEHRYALRHEPAAARDEAAVADRNAAVLDTAAAVLRRGRGRVPLWEIVATINASGLLHHPTPPDPFEEIWSEEVWGPIQDYYGVDYPLVGAEGGLFAGLGQLLGGLGQGSFDLARLGEEPEARGPVAVEIDAEDLPPGVGMDEFRAAFEAVYAPDGLHPLPADHPLLAAISAVAARSGLPSPTGARYKASQLQAMFGSDDDTLDWIDEGIALGMVEEDEDDDPEGMLDESVPDLPAAYARTGAPREAQPSARGRVGPVQTYLLRLTLRGEPGFSRDIEIAEDQSFEDLHLSIQRALDWDDDHLYSFFMGRRPHDPAREIGSPWSDSARHTHQVTLGGEGLRPKQKFFYLFDYGDEHLFTLEVLKVNAQAPQGAYPKVVASQGRAPSQYVGEDDLDEDEEDE